MAAIILFVILENEDNQNSRNLYIERLLSDPDDVLHFDDKTLINRHRFPRAMILQLVEQLRPALERATRRHRALPVVVQPVH